MIRCLWVPFVWLLAVVVRGAEDVPVYDIPKLDKIVIDGNAADWRQDGLCIPFIGDPKGQMMPGADLRVSLRLGWDPRGLLVLARVRDDQRLESDDAKQLWKKDDVELFVSTQRGDRETYQVILAPGADPAHGELRLQVFDRRRSLRTEQEPTVTAASTVATDGYTLEMVLPWENLKIVPHEGREIGFQFMVSDFDVGEQKAFAAWFPSDKASSDPLARQRLRLVSGPVPLTTQVAGGHMVGCYPTVCVAGPRELVGKTATVTSGGRQLASGPLESGSEGAFLELTLPYPRPGNDYAGVAISVEGKQIGRLDISSASLPELKLTTVKAAEGTKLRVEAPRGDTYAAVHVLLTATNTTMKQGAATECAVNEDRVIQLPTGLFDVTARVDDYFGHKLEANTACFVGDDPRGMMPAVLTEAQSMQSRPDLAAYAGWLSYLSFPIEQDLAGSAPGGRPALEAAVRTADWIRRIREDRELIAKLRGEQEWAYRSKADDSGQPFTLEIPETYDPKHPYPLHIGLHGATRTHRDGKAPGDSSSFGLRVMGRCRGQGYRGLGEVDILEAIDYVRSHWNIDESRIDIQGGSMGGNGAFWLAARHPDLFVTARPMSGWAGDAPIENMLHVPVYALHGLDDTLVPIPLERVGLRYLTEQGGEAVLEEVRGFGHAVDGCRPSMDKMRTWADHHARNPEIRQVRYTAIDELARGAYWVEVAEWGPQCRPAHIEANLGRDNTLYLALDNVACLRVDLTRAPVNRDSALQVVIDGKLVATLPPPLSASVYVTSSTSGWAVASAAPPMPRERLHFPGGAMALFHGEPILVVWGTQGPEDVRQKIHQAARAAMVSSGPLWPDPVKGGDACLFTGNLPGKADSEVTQADIETRNLLLIGTASQNSLVARMASNFPVKIEAGRVICSDGVSWNAEGRALGLLCPNPLAPKRLVYWAASDSAGFYAPWAPLMARQSDGPTPPDFVLAGATSDVVIAARRFDSRWQWESNYVNSPLLPASLCVRQGWNRAVAESIRRVAEGDFVLTDTANPGRPVWEAGQTRRMDVLAWDDRARVAAMDLSGKEIAELAGVFKALRKDGPTVFQPVPATLNPNRLYRVALANDSIWGFTKQTGADPQSLRLLDRTVRESLGRHLPEMDADETQPE